MPIPLRVHLTPETVDPRALSGAVAVVVDVLRASTTMVAALEAGAVCIVPCPEPADAVKAREGIAGPCVLGGERRGVRIDGFDLGNSPREYTREAVGGRTLVFTTTNGTRALLRCAGASRVLVGCLANRAAVCGVARAAGRPVHVVCAGTDGAMCLDDVVAAGAIAQGLAGDGGGFEAGDGDAARLAMAAFRSTGQKEAGLAALLAAGRGGRNLVGLGLVDDILDCARLDSSAVVPEFDAAGGVVTRAGGAA